MYNWVTELTKCVFRLQLPVKPAALRWISPATKTNKKMLDAASIPVANGGICVDEEDLDEVIRKIGYQLF